MELSEFLTEYLISHNMSLRDFARQCHVSHSYLKYLRDGRTGRGDAPHITIKTLSKIASGMGLSVNDLMGQLDAEIAWGANSNLTANENEEELLAIFRSLNPDGQKAALSMLNGLSNGGAYSK